MPNGHHPSAGDIASSKASANARKIKKLEKRVARIEAAFESVVDPEEETTSKDRSAANAVKGASQR